MGSNELGNINHNTSNDSSLSPQLATAKRALPSTNETSADLSAASSTTSTTTSPETVPNDPFPPPSFTIVRNKSTKRRKRRKVDTTRTDETKRLIMDQALAPIESYFEESQKKLSLTFCEFSDLIRGDLKSMEGSELAETYPDLEEIIEEVYVRVSEPTIKSKLTRMKNKMKSIETDSEKMAVTEYETDTDLESDKNISNSRDGGSNHRS
ncbi:hypothetical protein QAD02_023608 [Eretmocerus hayati]|uniref:Uncharacterized protein n=1 Tax=Eretmocerus hayati TaxID=131215 RepID=A0ACC2PYS2_9HYME|nr:hypothetical protein QAD02_023608 [Eretmocerus hayati]